MQKSQRSARTPDATPRSERAAAALHGIGPPSLLPHILVPPSSSARTPLARVHRGDLARRDRTRVDGIPCTTASRALVDSAGLRDLFHNPRRYAHDEDRHARLIGDGWRIDHVSKRDLLPTATRIPELLVSRRAA